MNVSTGSVVLTTWLTTSGIIVGRHATSGTSWSTVPLMNLRHPIADELPGGGLVVAGTRCAWRPDGGAENNAVLLDPSLSVLTTGCIGDGVEHLAVDDRGSIWCGYFDEGIFGNLGWGGPGPEPIGSSGLVRFDDLLPSWSLDAPSNFGIMADCYALNVGPDVWACYYTDFPLVRVRRNESVFWHNRTGAAPHALLVDEPLVALIGGYRDDRDLVVLGRLEGDEFLEEERTRIGAEDGTALPKVRMFGRGPHLHAITDDTWYQLTLNDLRATHD